MSANETDLPRTRTPARCHLWTRKDITGEEIRRSLALLHTYEDESHLMRHLMKCNACGQLYFHEFYEIVDWKDGNDAQYSTWIPIEDVESADRLNKMSPLELLRFAGLRIDFPSDATKPSAPYWNLRDRESGA